MIISCVVGLSVGAFAGMKYQAKKDNREGLVMLYGDSLIDIQIYKRIKKLIIEEKKEKVIKLVESLEDGAKITEENIGKNLTKSEKEEAKRPQNNAL